MIVMDAAEWKIADDHIREIIQIELRHRDIALKNQAREYERRLQILNNENARILAAGQRAVSLEKYEAEQHALTEWRKSIDKFMVTTETRHDTIMKEQTKLRVVIIAWITVASFALALGAALGFPDLIP